MLRATLTFLIALCIFAQAPALAQFEPSPSPGFVVFHCRGPLHLQASSPSGIRSVLLHIQSAPGPSGARGENLASGQCAFVDRALRSGEPLRIRWEVLRSSTTSADDRMLTAAAFQLLATCARDPDCILRTSVRNAGFPVFNLFIPIRPLEVYSITTLR